MDIGKAVLEAVREAQKPFFNHEDFSGSGWGIHLPKVSFAGFAPFL